MAPWQSRQVLDQFRRRVDILQPAREDVHVIDLQRHIEGTTQPRAHVNKWGERKGAEQPDKLLQGHSIINTMLTQRFMILAGTAAVLGALVWRR